jgi:hypothetical protein
VPRTLSSASVPAVVAVLMLASSVSVLAQQGGQRPDEDPVYFDLGIDVRILPQDSAGAKRYFASQISITQHVLLATCDNYIKHPVAAEMPETITFCKALFEGGAPKISP